MLHELAEGCVAGAVSFVVVALGHHARAARGVRCEHPLISDN
jgi:hypothetical protein